MEMYDKAREYHSMAAEIYEEMAENKGIQMTDHGQEIRRKIWEMILKLERYSVTLTAHC